MGHYQNCSQDNINVDLFVDNSIRERIKESPLHFSKVHVLTFSDTECYELTRKSTTITNISKSMSKLDTTVVPTILSSNRSSNTYEDKYVYKLLLCIDKMCVRVKKNACQQNLHKIWKVISINVVVVVVIVNFSHLDLLF